MKAEAWSSTPTGAHHLIRWCCGVRRGRGRRMVTGDTDDENPNGGWWCGVCAQRGRREINAARAKAEAR